MQHNLRQFPYEQKNDGRRNSLDIPTHGRVPRWLEDMSSEVERSHSLIMSKEYLEANNNEKYGVFASKTESNIRSTESTPSGSARYGRRSSSSNSQFTKGFTNYELDTYIVPKMDETGTKKQYDEYGFKPYYEMTASRLSQNSDAYHSSEDQQFSQSYSPSCLEQTTGRRSRLDVISDQISTSLNNLSLTENFEQHSDQKPKHFKVQNAAQYRADCTKNISSFLLKEDLPDRKKFEEDFLLLKSKIQKYKKSKQQRKSKYKNQNLATIRRELQEIPQTYIGNTPGENIPNGNTEPEEIFIIPELPTGLIMIVDILSTWGDRYYVGLNGIELFDSDGNLVQVRKITACPEDINILPECNGDPRVVTNLLDSINRTQDDNHLWLTPFDSGEHHLVTMEFYKKTELAMIRIWNYNKSRIHSFRGARDVVITLDGICIFRGEIAQACGSILGGIESFGDTILFTTEESILEKIALNDISFSTLMSSDKDLPDNIERPPTATAIEETHQRPYTHALTQKHEPESDDQLFGAHRLDIALVLNWGKAEYIGMTGLEVIGDSDISLTIPKDNIRANNVVASAMLARLIDDENITTDRKHMWYTQYVPGEEIVISVFFDQLTYVAGVRIWNYNENIEMTFCGARMIKLFLDGKPMINPLTNDSTFLLRRAPGNTNYDYVQEIKFCHNSLVGLQQEPFYDFNNLSGAKEELFENPILPEGFVFQIVIYTTWGDQYYVGLNGIEIFDQNGKKIVLTESTICAHPESVNVLPGVSGDIRTPDKLVDGINDRSDGTHSWLVPVIPKCLNRIYIVFDQPVAISVMKLWNYLKTPTRGVKEFGILVDDLLIYNGILDKINDKSSVKYRTILFTNNKNVLQKEMASLVKHSIDSQATVLTNDEPRVTTGGSLPNADQSLRPFTSVNYLNRGRTSQSN